MTESKKKAAEPSKSDKLAAARKALAAAKALLSQAAEEIRPAAVALSSVERNESAGKLRVGEASVIAEVLDAADKHPALVAGHADSDGGVDPARFETELLREWLDLHTEFATAADEIGATASALVTLLGDTAKFYGAKARKPVLRVYGDLSVLSDNNPELRKDLTVAKAYYGAIGRKAARTRGKKK